MRNTHNLSTSRPQTYPEHLPQIVLGSSSVFRKALLDKLHLPFSQSAPEINESPLAKETPKQMVARLSLEKAKALQSKHSDKIIIASDQTACFNDKPLGKPGNFDKAKQQLEQFSGNKVVFYTGLAVFNPKTQAYHQAMDITEVYFRCLTQETIENYLQIEQPYQCAGSFKSEGLGITLFEKIQSQDPNALIGLPLIELTSIFKHMGIQLPLKPATTN